MAFNSLPKKYTITLKNEILINRLNPYGLIQILVLDSCIEINMRVTYKKGNSSTESLAYTALVRPILEYGAVCWDPYREGQIHASDRVQKKAAKFAHLTNELNWETLSQRRKISRICAVFKAYSGERAWKAISDRIRRPNYMSRVDHARKIRSRRQRMDIGKYSFVNRTIRLWNRLPAEILETLSCKPNAFRKRVRKVINGVN